MTIATENVSENEIENGNQADDHPSGNENRNGNVNENENGIVETNVVIPRIVQDIKKRNQDIEDPAIANNKSEQQVFNVKHETWRHALRCSFADVQKQNYVSFVIMSYVYK